MPFWWDAMSLGLGLSAGEISCSGHSHLTPSFPLLTPDNLFFIHVYPFQITVPVVHHLEE